jgi:hypothetical protein
MTISILIFSFALVGVAFSPSRLLSQFFYLPVGIVYFILFTSSISNIFQLKVGVSATLTILLSVLVIGLRIRLRNIAFLQVLKKGKDLLPTVLLIGPVLGFLLKSTNIDFAARNFDAHYAIVDGLFLFNNSASSSIIGSQRDELLPMDWSASTNLRYGMSFVVSFLETIQIGDAWTNAQYVFFALLIILSLTIYSFSRDVLKRSKKVSLILSLLVSLSPISLVNINYFMFGQTLALPVLILGFLVLGRIAIQRSEYILQVAILMFFFVAYPAMLFPSLVFFFLCLGRAVYQSKIKLTSISKLFLVLIVMSLVVYGFEPSAAISRLIIWVMANLDPQSVNLSADESIPITIFSQFTSILGFPLTLGLIPYPFLGDQFFFVSLLLNVLIFFVVFQSAKHVFQSLRKDENLIPIFLFFFAWLLVPVFGFLGGNSYLYIKVMIWISPLVALVFWDLVVGKFVAFVQLLKVRAVPSIGTSVTLVLLFSISVMMMQTSLTYGKMFPKWDSFIQRPMPSVYSEFKNSRFDENTKVAINATTAEEALWTAGLFGIRNNQFYSLGVKTQALGEGLTTKCSKPFAQKNFREFDFILENTQKQDVGISSQYKAGSRISSIGDWELLNRSGLEFAIVMNGSGTFPPTILAENASPISGSNVFRWSSGQVCFSIFTNKTLDIQVTIPYSRGPDFNPEGVWKVVAGNRSAALSVTETTLGFGTTLNPGWNLVQVSRSDCNLTSVESRWTRRADDRLLCFAVGKITTSGNS